MDLVSSLGPEQQQPITAGRRPALFSRAPAPGRRVIAHRIAYLVSERRPVGDPGGHLH
jgi:hypothetical protein